MSEKKNGAEPQVNLDDRSEKIAKIQKAQSAVIDAQAAYDAALQSKIDAGTDAKKITAAEKEIKESEAVLQAKKEVELKIRINAAKSTFDGKEYIPEDDEKSYFHVSLEKEAWEKGTKRSKPYIQKFNVREYDMFNKNNAWLGYTTEVLWDPTLFNL